MSDKKTGGPAFSRAGNEWSEMAWVEAPAERGMTLRDYFAAKAMQVMMAETNGQGDKIPGSPRWNQEEVADFAYDQADAMLKKRMET